MRALKALFAAGLLVSALALVPAFAHGMLMQVKGDGKTVSGRVVFGNGEPAAGEWVEMFDLTAPATKPQSMATDDDGTFRFPGVNGHRYRIKVTGQEDHVVESTIVLGPDSRGKPVSTGSSHDQ